MKRSNIILASVVLSCLLCCRVFADESGAHDKKSFISHDPGHGISIDPLDITIKPAATYVFQGVSNANKGSSGGLHGAWRTELDAIKEFGKWGEAKIRLISGNGKAATKYINAFSNVDNNTHITHGDINAHTFWYKQYLFERQFDILVGKLDPTDWFDLNNYADNHRTQFLADIFNNAPSIDWPINNSFGVHAAASPESVKSVQFAFDYFDTDWKDMFINSVFGWTVNIRPAYLFGIDPKQYEGNYRFYGWFNDSPHAKLIEGGISSADTDNSNYGVGLSCDQKLNDIFGLFGRFGWQRPDVADLSGGATLEWLWSLGAQMRGRYWKRKDDVLAFGVGQSLVSDDYKKAGHAGSPEGHFELYYNCKVNAYISITPDIQVIWNPNGKSADSAIFVYGARTQFYF